MSSEQYFLFWDGCRIQIFLIFTGYISILRFVKTGSNLILSMQAQQTGKGILSNHQVTPRPFQPAMSLGAVGVCHTEEVEMPAGRMRQHLNSNLRCSLAILGW